MTDGGRSEIEGLHAYARALGLPRPEVRRRTVRTDTGTLSMLQWGSGRPEFVFVHGAGLQAQAWNRVLLRLGRPALAFDLPGHGLSDRLPVEGYRIAAMGDMLAAALASTDVEVPRIVGHSLGSFVAARAAEQLADFDQLVVVDATPHRIGTRDKARLHVGTVEELVGAMRTLMPDREPAGLERAVIRNTRQRADGRREWLWDAAFVDATHLRAQERDAIWATLHGAGDRVVLLRGARGSVTDGHAAEFTRRVPGSRVITVDDAGHNVHADAPVWLAEWLRGPR